MKKICLLLAALTLAASISACGAKKSASGGCFNDYITAPVGTFNMYTTSDSSAYELSRRCTARLYTMLPREDGEGFYYAPDLAESAPVPADGDGCVFRVTFRRGYSWQNGEEITPDDFIYSMRTLLSPDEK
ncbi:MAG: hypothetical protein IJS65_08580, partial [Clostridia bacterium]|nr:hypothetical protein [Clostridia bacterium]